MLLRQLRLENIRSIEHLVLDFERKVGAGGDGSETPAGRRWTLLLGQNGSGKSTILRAIALVLAGRDALAELLVQGGTDTWIRNGAKQGRIGATLATAAGERREVELVLTRGLSPQDTLIANRVSLASLDNALEHSTRSYLTVGYGASRRLNGDSPKGNVSGSVFRHPRAQSVATLFTPDATLLSLETWAMDLDYRRGAAGMAVIREAINGLLPDVQFGRVDKKQRRLLFTTRDGEVPLSALSDGYQNVAAWCADLLFRITETFKDYKRPLDARGLLLIDEIELHLHPLWQRQLRTFLDAQMPNFQIVATTHSALTAQQSAAGELFSVRRTDSGESALYAFPAEPRKLMVHQLLMSDLIGLKSIDSPQIEAAKDAYRALSGKKRRTRSDEQAMKALRAKLEDTPDWSRETPQDRDRLALLRSIAKELDPKASGRGTRSLTRGSALANAAQSMVTSLESKPLAPVVAKAPRKTRSASGTSTRKSAVAARKSTTTKATKSPKKKAATKGVTARRSGGGSPRSAS